MSTLISCSKCCKLHERPGGGYCTYYRLAVDRARAAGEPEAAYIEFLDFSEPPLPEQGLKLEDSMDTVDEVDGIDFFKLLTRQSERWDNERDRMEAAFQAKLDTVLLRVENLLEAKGATAADIKVPYSPTNPFVSQIVGVSAGIQPDHRLDAQHVGGVSKMAATPSPLRPALAGELRKGEVDLEKEGANIIYVREERSESDRRRRKLTVYSLTDYMVYCGSFNTRTVDHIIEALLAMLQSRILAGTPCVNLLSHIRFLVEKRKTYTSASLMRYDQAVREKAEFRGGEAVLEYCDTELSHRFLGVENLVNKQSPSSPSKFANSKPTGPRNKPGSDLAWGVCWRWNEDRPCSVKAGGKCEFRHQCSACHGDHKATTCSKK